MTLPRATPDSFVAIVPMPWTRDESATLAEAFEEMWALPAECVLEPCDEEGAAFVGSLTADGLQIGLVVEEPIPELVELVGTSLEPFADTEVVGLREHASIWRLTVAGSTEAAVGLARAMMAFVEAGGFGVFMPSVVRLHSPRALRKLTMELDVQALTNLFVGAYHTDDWMRTRGLTGFGWSEIETPTTQGLNGAYFALMDVAASMIARAEPYQIGDRLQSGPKFYKLVEGPRGPADPQVPINGHFGVQVLTDRPRD